MNLAGRSKGVAAEEVGREMHRLIADLYPICRSITGEGFRETLRRIQKFIPLNLYEVPTGTRVFDWTVPKEWNIRDAYIKDPTGRKVVDFGNSNLHVVSYSIPVRKTIALSELKEYLFTLPDHPDWIPYRTSYYKEQWGYCLSHNQLLSLRECEYEVCIDSSLEDGSLTYGEYYVQGESSDEVLFSCHVCHPSLCNDNLSGVALSVFLAKHLTGIPLRYSYRFLFIPGTIGSITWLALHKREASRIKHGLVIVCVGDPGHLTYKKSRRGNAEVDQAVIHVLETSGDNYEVMEFFPYGYDERQYCSPGFNLPVGSLTRTPHGRFPEYHTSADNLEFVKAECLADTFLKYLRVLEVLEGNRKYINLNPRCEPQLGRRGLYRATGGAVDGGLSELAMLWVLNLSDGEHSLLDICNRSGLAFSVIRRATDVLLEHHLIEEKEKSSDAATSHRA